MSGPATYPSLDGKRVFVSGGATGIGAAIVESFAAQSARVHFVDIDKKASTALAARLGERVSFAIVDAADPKALAGAIADFAAAVGGLDSLINNVANDQRHTVADATPDGWRRCMAINLDAAFFAAQKAITVMPPGGGAIVNLSSINALLGPAGMIGYNTAKAGLLGMTKSLARELGERRIRVNAVLPGWVATERQLALWLTPAEEAEWTKLTALKDRIEAIDIANSVVFLAAEESRMITGQTLIVDAGRV